MDTPDKPNVAAVKAQLVAFTYEEVLEAAKLLDQVDQARLRNELEVTCRIFAFVEGDADDILETLNDDLEPEKDPFTIEDVILACRSVQQFDQGFHWETILADIHDEAHKIRNDRVTEPGNAP